jgi:hypothetical protein
MNFMYLPTVLGLIGFGWWLGRNHDAVIQWLLDFLDDDELPPATEPMLRHPSMYGRGHCKLLHAVADDFDGGDAA